MPSRSYTARARVFRMVDVEPKARRRPLPRLRRGHVLVERARARPRPRASGGTYDELVHSTRRRSRQSLHSRVIMRLTDHRARRPIPAPAGRTRRRDRPARRTRRRAALRPARGTVLGLRRHGEVVRDDRVERRRSVAGRISHPPSYSGCAHGRVYHPTPSDETRLGGAARSPPCGARARRHRSMLAGGTTATRVRRAPRGPDPGRGNEHGDPEHDLGDPGDDRAASRCRRSCGVHQRQAVVHLREVGSAPATTAEDRHRSEHRRTVPIPPERSCIGRRAR